VLSCIQLEVVAGSQVGVLKPAVWAAYCDLSDIGLRQDLTKNPKGG